MEKSQQKNVYLLHYFLSYILITLQGSKGLIKFQIFLKSNIVHKNIIVILN